MKKLVLLACICFAVVMGAKQLKGHNNDISPLLLYNIEALAADEISMPIYCLGTGSVDCPINHSKVDYVTMGYRL